jgi:transcription antitermination factor NusG
MEVHPAVPANNIAEFIADLCCFPKRMLKCGDRVRILAGPFKGHLAIYAGMSGPERVAVLLQILGGPQRVTLAQRDIEAIIS